MKRNLAIRTSKSGNCLRNQKLNNPLVEGTDLRNNTNDIRVTELTRYST